MNHKINEGIILTGTNVYNLSVIEIRQVFSSVQLLSRVRLWDPMDCSTPGLPVHHQLLEFTQTHVHWVGDAIQSSHPLLPPSPPTFNLSNISVFSKESILPFRWPKYWSYSLSISPSIEYSGLISFWIDWFDLAVQGTLKSLLQHPSWKASILWCSAFFTVQLSHLYMTTGKAITLTIWTFVSEVEFNRITESKRMDFLWILLHNFIPTFQKWWANLYLPTMDRCFHISMKTL